MAWSASAAAQIAQPEGGAAATTESAPAPESPAAPETAADDANQGGLEEIVVTAQRRAEAVQEVPIAISAFSAEQLAARGVNQTLDLIQQVPNLFGSNNTGLGSANAYYLRGLGNTETIATFDPPVGTYIDDIYLSRQNANNFGFFDLERIEVLRGPQGTLFGRNTTGGAINVILKRPGDELGGFAEVGFGRFDRYLARASIDLPFSDGLAFKLSGYYQDDKGYARNVTTGERTNDNDGAGLRGAFRAEISDAIEWNVAATYIRSSAENNLNFTCRNPALLNSCDDGGRYVSTGLRKDPSNQGASQFAGTIALVGGAPQPVSGRKALFNNENETDTVILSSNLEFGGENHTLNLITGVVDLTQKFALDFFDGRSAPALGAGTPIPPGGANPLFPPVRGLARGGFTIVNDGEHEQFSQEIKLNGNLFGGFVDYVVGAYLYRESNRTDFADIFGAFSPAVPGGIGFLLADRILDNDTKAEAGYGQFDFNVTDALKLTAGIRFTDERKTIELADLRPQCQTATAPASCLFNGNLIADPDANPATPGVPIPTKLSTSLWTPRFAVNYEPTDDILFYASATRGFKSGGWNARATSPSQFLPFDPEKVWSYEAGVKSEWFDRRLRVNLSAYQMDVSDLQTPSAFVNPATGAITFITQNFADYRNRGLEAEFTTAPIEGLNLFLNIGYQDDEYLVTTGPSSLNRYGIEQSASVLQALCRSQLAAGRVPGATGAANATACGAGIVTATGEIAEPVRTPDWSVAAGFTYDLEIGGEAGFILTPSANVSYRSAFETGTANLSFYDQPVTTAAGSFVGNPFGNGNFVTGSASESYTLVNASLTLRTADRNWAVSIECENCFDEVYNQSSLSNFTYISPPGTWFIRARRNF